MAPGENEFDARAVGGVLPFRTSAPHWEKSWLGPDVKYTAHVVAKKRHDANLQFRVGSRSQSS